MSRENPLRRYARFFGADPHRDVDDELAFHLAMRVEEFERQGMTREAAEEAARERFGRYGAVREECRELGRRRVTRRRRTLQLAALRRDVGYAFRGLAANRVFALTIVLTLALGIGAATSVFSVAHGVLLRPLPYRDADALVRLWSKNDERGLEFFSVSPADFRDWREQNRVFTAMGAFERQHGAILSRGAEPQEVEVAAVSPAVFPLLGTSALRGRALVDGDAGSGAPKVVVLSHGAWAARFGSDSAIIGSDVLLDGERHEIVGVMPPRFAVPGTSAELWTPLSLAGASEDHSNRYLRVLARLAPGATPDQARLQMDVVARRLGKKHPETNGLWSVNLLPVPEMVVGSSFRLAVLALLGVVGFVLLIACANSANLQLARGAGRRREFAVRAALGATRGRIVRQLLTESLLIGLLATAAGCALAYGGLGVLRAVGTEIVPRLDEVRLDAPVLAFSAMVALGSALLFGLLPALRASRSEVGDVLRTGGRGTGRTAMAHGLRSAFVVAQIALSSVLLIGASLMMRSFVRLQSVDVGFEANGVAVFPLHLPASSYSDEARAAAFQDAVLQRVRRTPGVVSAGAVSNAPFAGPSTGLVFNEEGVGDARDQSLDADYRVITPGYLQTLGVRLIGGRDFSSEDRAGAPGTVLVSESMARRHWPRGDAIGRRLRLGDRERGPVVTIVGVVGDVRYQSLEDELRPMIYFSSLARPERAMAIVYRVRGGATTHAGAVQAIRAIDPSLPLPGVSLMSSLVAEATATRRFALALFAIFASVALVLATVGVYGVMAYLVRQQEHEFGVRIALGAAPRALVGAVVGTAFRLAVAGVVVGLAVAWALTRSIEALLFEVSATDPAIFAGVATLLAGVAVVASLVPARRASRADPLTAMREEG